MKLVRQNLSKWILAAIVLVCGILCIVAGASINNGGAAGAADAISMVLGITLIIVGSLSVALAVFVTVSEKKGFATVALAGAVVLAIGISLVVGKYAFDLIGLFLYIIPYLLLALGIVLVADSVFKCVFARKFLVSVVVALCVGVVAIVLGALCVGNDPVIKQDVQLIVFGVIVVLTALLQFAVPFLKPRCCKDK